jgi:hypothetical protein
VTSAIVHCPVQAVARTPRAAEIYPAAQAATNRTDASSVTDPLPARISDDGRAATWNPALTRAAHVLVHVRCADGALVERRSMNSGRARVREDETIEAVVPAGE